jgi:hypothetical protein
MSKVHLLWKEHQDKDRFQFYHLFTHSLQSQHIKGPRCLYSSYPVESKAAQNHRISWTSSNQLCFHSMSNILLTA